ncbi:LuxR C-terminal-related transcriptional regulator [Pararhizobium sp. DWP1-1-3]|uniref:LuxR C-terminal-related transcriptional regulator n=1 Tax=Pararhizobium sp. DWP1-1-3 TaxID=2804652 RepID=UPI003CF54D23
MVTQQSRFQPPVNGGQHVRRRNLLQQLQRVAPRRLTTIIAPAGYGKTSFAAQWHDLLRNHGGNVVWVPLEADDCDQNHFLLALLEALQDLHPGEGRGLDASNMPVATLLSVLITRLRRIEAAVTLFLDDYHFAQTDATESLLAKLLAAKELAHVKFVLISRSAPRFPISALRLNGELKQIGVADLSFSDTEAQEFFVGRAEKLTREQIGELNKRTEGWAVALQMVRVLVAESSDSASILESFDGSNAEMARYLSEQVFSSLPEDIQHFLVETASLPAISRTLAAAICDSPDAATLFNRLADYALPIATLDAQGMWIRCHPVFNSFLKEEAVRVGIETHDFLRRAARWFQTRDDCEAAVRHALLAGDTALAAEIIETSGGWRRVYATTRGGTLLFQTLITKAADINLSGYPLTTLGLCVISAKAGQLDAANHYLAIAERVCTGQILSRDLRVVRVLMSLYTDRWASTADLSALEDDLAYGSDIELIHRALALNMLAYNFLIRTDLDRAIHYGQLAMRAFRDGGADFGAMHLYTHIGQAAFFSGDSASAEDAYRSLIAEAQSNVGEGSDLDAVGQVLLSEVLSMRGEHDAASAALSWALPHLERHDTWFDLLAAGFMAQQRVLRLNGDVLAAHAAIDSARSAARRRGFDRLTRLIDGERVTLLVATGSVEEAVRYAEASGFAVQTAYADTTNNLSLNLRGCVPALLWTRIYAARGDNARARDVFDRMRTQQALKPHVPRRIELEILDIRLSLAEDRPDRAAACLSNLLLSQPVADYRAILQIEGADFTCHLRCLATLMEIPEVISQRLAHVLDGPPMPAPADSASASAAAAKTVAEPGGLTERERSVMRLLSAGLSNKEIGRQLDLSDNTVKFHLRNIFAKFNVTTRTAAVTAGRNSGLLP